MENVPDRTYIGGVYWRRSLLIGRQCLPAILTLSRGRLAMTSGGTLIVDTPLIDLTVRISRWGTMLLRVGAKEYAIVGHGAPGFFGFLGSPRFREGEVRQLWDAYLAGTRGHPVVVVGAVEHNGSVDVVGITNSSANVRGMYDRTERWHQVFETAGVAVSRG